MSNPVDTSCEDGCGLSGNSVCACVLATYKTTGLAFCVFKLAVTKVKATLDAFLSFKMASFLLDVCFFSYSVLFQEQNSECIDLLHHKFRHWSSSKSRLKACSVFQVTFGD